MKKIFFENLSSWKLPENSKTIQKKILKIVDFVAKLQSYELTILVVNDSEIQIYNRERRRKNKPTDVLSFPIAEEIPSPHKILGEILISHETLSRQAQEIGHSEKEEFYRLLIHGILHLLGYDHERGKEEERLMQEMEDKCWDLIFNQAGRKT